MRLEAELSLGERWKVLAGAVCAPEQVHTLWRYPALSRQAKAHTQLHVALLHVTPPQ
jgi:hypothetical protein